MISETSLNKDSRISRKILIFHSDQIYRDEGLNPFIYKHSLKSISQAQAQLSDKICYIKYHGEKEASAYISDFVLEDKGSALYCTLTALTFTPRGEELFENFDRALLNVSFHRRYEKVEPTSGEPALFEIIDLYISEVTYHIT